MLPNKFRSIWPICVRVVDFLEIDQSGKNNCLWWPCLLTDSDKMSNLYKRTFHRRFLPSFGSFGNAVSEEIFRNRPIRNKNRMWWPCLLMDRDRMSNLYRGPSIDASYQVSVHLAKWFQRRRLKCEKLTDEGRRTSSDGKTSHCLWQGELKMFKPEGLLYKVFC